MSAARGEQLPGNRWDLLAGRVPEPLPGVSVVVAHFRQQAELDRTLLALARQDYPAGLVEVIVVDDGSPLPPVVPEGVRLAVQEDRGFRLSAARNRGAALATHPVLCFLDADTAPEPGYLRALTRLPALAPDVVAVGRRRHADLAATPPDEPVEAAGPRHELDEPRWLLDAYAASGDLLRVDDRSYRFVIGAVIACSAALFRATGGFDESFDRYGGEDWEWAYRAWLAGAVLAHVRDAVAWHDGPDAAGRPADSDALARVNDETLLLTELIPVPGSAGRGLRGSRADTVVHGPEGAGPAQRFVSLDSALVDLPLAAVADAAPPASLDRVRIDVRLLRPVRVEPGALRPLVDRLVAESLGSIEVTAPDGEALLRIESRRARARAERWGDDSAFEAVSVPAEGIAPLGPQVRLAAYLGGWG